MPWKRTGLNSMTTPDQLISQPMAPVKTGIEANATQSTSLTPSPSQSTRGSSALTAPRRFRVPPRLVACYSK